MCCVTNYSGRGAKECRFLGRSISFDTGSQKCTLKIIIKQRALHSLEEGVGSSYHLQMINCLQALAATGWFDRCKQISTSLVSLSFSHPELVHLKHTLSFLSASEKVTRLLMSTTESLIMYLQRTPPICKSCSVIL